MAFNTLNCKVSQGQFQHEAFWGIIEQIPVGGRAAQKLPVAARIRSTRNDVGTTMNQPIATTPLHWCVRGVMVGILLSGALNAVSYFWRSERWGNLLGTTPGHREALGFPSQLWENGNAYGGYFIDPPALLANAAFAMVVAAACGWIMVRYQTPLTRLVVELEELTNAESSTHLFRFSLRGLLVATCLAGVFAAGLHHALARRPEVLGMIYLFGPWVLVLIALLPMGMSWQQRVIVLIPSALLLMVGAVAIGHFLKPGIEFDKVLLGIFICWTPQCVLAAIGVTAALIYESTRSDQHKPTHDD